MNTTRSLILFSASLFISAVTLYGQAEAAPSGNSSSTLWGMISQGGWAMFPLGLCSLALIYLAIHCARETKPSKFGDERFGTQLQTLCKSGRIKEAQAVAKQDPSLLGRAFANALPKLSSEDRADTNDKIDETIQETFALEEHAIGQWIHYINVIASVSPMIGLLGTVSGMIGAFQTMSAGGMGRPELLAGNIGEALITTATGLCIGIPAMVAYSYFTNRLNNQLVENVQRANAISESLIHSS